VFVARQLVKHKFLRWNEISRRYVDSEPEFYLPRSWRGRSEDKKQGSTGEWYDDDLDFVIKDGHTACLNSYKELLEDGVCPEQARMVLPQSMMTEWYWSAETAEVARGIDRIMTDLFPVSWRALRENEQ
jgi:thymidylate synthase (FAD)